MLCIGRRRKYSDTWPSVEASSNLCGSNVGQDLAVRMREHPSRSCLALGRVSITGMEEDVCQREGGLSAVSLRFAWMLGGVEVEGTGGEGGSLLWNSRCC